MVECLEQVYVHRSRNVKGLPKVSPKPRIPITIYEWQNMENVGNVSWTCGYCGLRVASDKGYETNGMTKVAARACPECHGLTLFTAEGESLPGAAPGSPVSGVPLELADLY